MTSPKKRDGGRNLTKGGITRLLFQLTVPMLAGILSMVMFNLVDTYFVGQLGKTELAALTLTFPVVLVVGSLAQGIGIGLSSLVSQAYGAGDRQLVGQLTTSGLLLGITTAALFVATGLLTIDPFFTLLGADAATLPVVREYMQIWYPGVLLVIVPMIGNNALRGMGNTRTPGLVMLIAVAVNGILDPLLIFGKAGFPALGVAGAAWATVIARLTTMSFVLYELFLRTRTARWSGLSPQRVLHLWRKILHLGLPAAAARLVTPVGLGILTGIAARFGHGMIAGFGVGGRVEMFALSVSGALASVLAPFIGQNLGAGRSDRVKAGTRTAALWTLAWGSAVYALLLLFPEAIAGIFSESTQVQTIAGKYFLLIGWAYGLQGVFMLVTAALNTLKKPLSGLLLTVLELGGLAVPLSLLGIRVQQESGMFAAIGISYALAAAAAWITIHRVLKGLPPEQPVIIPESVPPGPRSRLPGAP